VEQAVIKQQILEINGLQFHYFILMVPQSEQETDPMFKSSYHQHGVHNCNLKRDISNSDLPHIRLEEPLYYSMRSWLSFDNKQHSAASNHVFSFEKY
jgi:hypothetical protein